MTAVTAPAALTIAGSDSGGGAGIQADIKAMSALGVYAASAITALTAQNTRAVTAIHDVPADFVAQQIHTVMEDIPVRAIKIGMLSRPEVIAAVAEALHVYPEVPVVLDPVMVATSGDLLLQREAVSVLKSALLPLASLITPNLPEAAVLAQSEIPDSLEGMREIARRLGGISDAALLLKGGHLGGALSDDLFCDGEQQIVLSAPRVETRNSHGTGCTLSASIAAGLAKGLPLLTAVSEAKRYLTEALRQSDRLAIGRGHGPVHHFHHFWDS